MGVIIIIIITTVLMVGATYCACFKPGENEGISNYNYLEHTKEQKRGVK